MGDFTGFSFGDWSSTDPQHGIVKVLRVSGGDRYNETLHPEIRDRTAEVPGVNGEYYFGSDYGTRTFDIDIAFDSLTEEQFRELRKVFGTKDIKKLVFDERPYKYYMAKLESPIELSYICFDEPNYTWEKIPSHYDDELNQIVYVQGIAGDYEYKVYDGTKRRVYKGEGTISFICYFPFAKSVYKGLPSTEVESDWAISSGLLTEEYRINNNIDIYANGEIKTYNPGDVEVGFRLYLPQTVINNSTTIICGTDVLELDRIILNNEDVGVLIDTNNQLIIGISRAPVQDQDGNWQYTTSGRLYNQYIISGHFFHLQTNTLNNYNIIQIVGGGNGIQIFYDYLYF